MWLTVKSMVCLLYTSKVVANGAVATTSMLFIIEAVALGFFLKYSKFNKWINTLVAIVLLIVAIALGLNFPMYLNLSVWHIIIFAYILIASVTPCLLYTSGSCFVDFSGFSYFFQEFFQLLGWIGELF